MIGKIVLLLFLTPLFLSAENKELAKKMDKFLREFNTSANVSKSAVYNGQRAGYATGGSIVIRNRANITQPATVTLPKIDAGCGGIDIYAGGFSFVNKDELVNTMKDIGANSVGYAFLLALETISPQIANNIKELQSWANTINGHSINSCEMAAQLSGMAWPANTAAKERICQIAGTGKIFSDQISARQNCATIEEQKDVTNKFEKENSSQLISNYNIAWEALKSQSYVGKDDEIMEMMMTLLGTIVVSQDNRGFEEKEVFSARITDDNFIKQLLVGGSVPIYRCKDKKDKSGHTDKCLIMDLQQTTLSFKDSWVGKIQSNLETIQDKIVNEGKGNNYRALTDDEISMMTKSRISLFQAVNAYTAYMGAEVAKLQLGEIAEIVATDLLIKFCSDAVLAIKEGCEKLKRGQIRTTEVDEYLASVYRAEQGLRHFELTQRTWERESYLMQKITAMEEKIAEQIKLF